MYFTYLAFIHIFFGFGASFSYLHRAHLRNLHAVRISYLVLTYLDITYFIYLALKYLSYPALI